MRTEDELGVELHARELALARLQVQREQGARLVVKVREALQACVVHEQQDHHLAVREQRVHQVEGEARGGCCCQCPGCQSRWGAARAAGARR